MISTGLGYLDKLTGGLSLGDNVVWESADGVPVEYFIRSFFYGAADFSEKIIFISFNFSPHTIMQRYDYLFSRENTILIDAFTHGKGNSDSVFLDFYQSDKYDKKRVTCIENPKNITSFVSKLNEIERSNKEGSFYIFDGLTGMNELWKDEKAVLDFFTFTCPKLYDLKALAYWIVRRESHSKEFISGIMQTTQIVFSINTTETDYYELKVHKLQDRTPLYGSRPNSFKIIDGNILFEDRKTAGSFEIGDKVKNLRKEARMTQADLAAALAMTPGAISQIENDIITPSLQTLLQLSTVFSKPVDYFIGGAGGGMNSSGYLLSKKGGHRSVPHRHVDMVQIVDTDHYGIKPFYVTLQDDTSVEGPLMLHKGKEFIAVIQGSMKVIIGGDTVTAAEGDTLLVSDAFISRLQKTGDVACRFLYLLL